MPTFEQNVIDAVLRHMNNDHSDDNLLIARAFADPRAASATMVGLDDRAGHWTYRAGGEDRPFTVPWSGPITERQEIRREIVALCDTACSRLKVVPREH